MSNTIIKTEQSYQFQKQTEDIDEWIQGEYDLKESWHEDPKGYFLIRIVPEKKMIEAAYVNRDHVIKKVVYGFRAIDIYYTICKNKLVTRLDHTAYLGKELYKAEMALRYGKRYRQSFPLNFEDLNEVVKLEKNS